jgi:ABC-type transport system involved in multi-copper enzyme maturation permease subunit
VKRDLWWVLGGLIALVLMMITMDPRAVSLLFIAGSFAASLVFVIRYSRTQWRTLPEGRNIMALTSVLCGAFALVLLRRIVGNDGHPAWAYVWEALFGVLFGVLVWRVLLLFRAQRRKREAKAAADAARGLAEVEDL